MNTDFPASSTLLPLYNVLLLPYPILFLPSLPVSDHLGHGKPSQFTHSVGIQQDVVGAQAVVKD